MLKTNDDQQTLLKRIKAFNRKRNAAILLYKYAAMKENVYRFFRGTCHLFYEDLAAAKLAVNTPPVWICGDLHLENFGSYKSDNQLVYFDLNDFDEALLAPAHWEIVRLITSIFIAFESLQIERQQAEKLAVLFIKTYSNTLKNGKAVYIERQTATGIVKEFLDKARQQKHRHVVNKKTITTKKKVSLMMSHPKHLHIDKPLKKALMAHMQQWLKQDENSPYNYKVIDAAFRIAGTGSLGIHRYVLLLKSSNDTGAKYLLVDMKEAGTSALAPYTKIKQPQWPTNGERIMAIQNRMQNRPPALFSTTFFKGRQYMVQELQPEKDSIDFNLLKDRYRDMYRVVADMAVLTASAQLRSCSRQGAATADALIAFGAETDWHQKVLDYGEQYAAKVITDYNAFKKAVKQPALKIRKAAKKKDKPLAA